MSTLWPLGKSSAPPPPPRLTQQQLRTLTQGTGVFMNQQAQQTQTRQQKAFKKVDKALLGQITALTLKSGQLPSQGSQNSTKTIYDYIRGILDAEIILDKFDRVMRALASTQSIGFRSIENLPLYKKQIVQEIIKYIHARRAQQQAQFDALKEAKVWENVLEAVMILVSKRLQRQRQARRKKEALVRSVPTAF